MYRLSFESQFLRDFQELKRRHSELTAELRRALHELRDMGAVSDTYKPYILVNRGGN